MSFKSGNTKIILCYALVACALYFANMLVFRRTIEADVYLVLNLAATAVLSALVALAVNRWARNAGAAAVPVVFIAIAVTALIAVDLVISAVVMRNIGVAVPIVGEWLSFDFAMDARRELGVRLPIPAWSVLVFYMLSLLFGVFTYRHICLRNQVNKRLLAILLSLYIACISILGIGFAIYGDFFTFIGIRNFMGVGVRDVYTHVATLVVVQCFLFEFKKKSSKGKFPSTCQCFHCQE